MYTCVFHAVFGFLFRVDMNTSHVMMITLSILPLNCLTITYQTTHMGSTVMMLPGYWPLHWTMQQKVYKKRLCQCVHMNYTKKEYMLYSYVHVPHSLVLDITGGLTSLENFTYDNFAIRDKIVDYLTQVNFQGITVRCTSCLSW